MTTEDPQTTTLKALVSGRVQGVGYRYFVLQQARRLKLTGRVANLPDGKVQVRARGSREELEALAEELRRGPYMARVEDVKVEWGAACPEWDRFDVEL